jgi:hypothetical protein
MERGREGLCEREIRRAHCQVVSSSEPRTHFPPPCFRGNIQYTGHDKYSTHTVLDPGRYRGFYVAFGNLPLSSLDILLRMPIDYKHSPQLLSYHDSY